VLESGRSVKRVHACTRTHTGMHAGGREARCFISNRGTLLKERDAFARRVHALTRPVRSLLQERDGEGVRTNEKQDSRPSTLLRAALTTFIVFPCSIERNVTLPPLFALLGRPSSFDSVFPLPFFSLCSSAPSRKNCETRFASTGVRFTRGNSTHVEEDRGARNRRYRERERESWNDAKKTKHCP